MNIVQQFEEIKRLYFPRWDRLGEWRVNPKPQRKAQGYCDTEQKVIDVGRRIEDSDDQKRLLIHEICHAVASPGHGTVWQRRMEKAAERAESLGCERLAQLVREDATYFRDAADGEREAYECVENWLMDQPELKLSDVEKRLASEYGILLRDVRSTFRSLKSVFRRAQAYAIRVHAAAGVADR